MEIVKNVLSFGAGIVVVGLFAYVAVTALCLAGCAVSDFARKVFGK